MKKISTYFILFLTLTLSASCQQHSKVDAGGNSIINSNINVNDFEKLMKEKANVQLVDVRTPDEYKGGHLKQAMNMDYRSEEFSKLISTLDKDKPTFVYCLSGGRSGSAAKEMAALGFKEVYNMEGGIMKWNAAGKPVDSPDDAAASPGLSLVEFNSQLKGDKFILVDYNATWCAPCMKMMPVLEQLAKEKSDKLTFIKIDADKNKGLLKAKGIDAIPVLELYKDGKLIWKHNGYIEKDQLLSETKL